MSWNKNTVVMSSVDAVVKTLNDVGVEYNLELLGEVSGCGLNDDYGFGRDKYPIRKLTYGDKVLMEQMNRSSDCDCDDFLVSREFKRGDEPIVWPLEMCQDEEEENEQCDCSKCKCGAAGIEFLDKDEI
jgi:hypothetical protein